MELIKGLKDDQYEFQIKGRFTYIDSGQFREIIDVIRGRQCNSIVINLAALEFIDSTAIGMLLLAREEASNKQIQLSLCKAVQSQPEKVMKMAKFDQLFSIM